MAKEKIINIVIQVKRDSLEQWEKNNPILRPGEPSYVTDLGKFKVGDGKTHWVDLPYFLLETDTTSNVIIKTKESWKQYDKVISQEGKIYIYTQDDPSLNASPLMKIGDGLAYICDLPFVTGDLSLLGALAYKDSASADYTPAGTITFTTSDTEVVSGVSKDTDTVKGMTTAGSVIAGSAASLANGFVTSGSAASASFTEGAFVANVPTAIDTKKFNAGSLPTKAADSFNAGSQAELTTTVANEVLEIGFTTNTLPTFTEGTFNAGILPSLEAGFYTAGTAATKAADTFSFTANVPTAVDVSKFDGGEPTIVTLPTFAEKTFVSDVSTTKGTQAIPTAATFTGTATTIEVEGTATGTQGTIVVS